MNAVAQPSCWRLLHFSDIHAGHDHHQLILEALTSGTLLDDLLPSKEHDVPEIVLVTGDVLDAPKCSDHVAGTLVDFFSRLQSRGDVCVVPGNHDVRSLGNLLYRAPTRLADICAAARVKFYRWSPAQPRQAHEVPLPDDAPFELWAVDSTPVFTGIAAVGIFRQNDILRLCQGARRTCRPLVLFTHHHPLPQPVADESRVDHALVARFLRRLVASGDRDEPFMLGLGAASALCALHALERPVLILHGHKHYSSVRLVRGLPSPNGIAQNPGDILVAGAASATAGLPWVFEDRQLTTQPSINLVTLSPTHSPAKVTLTVESLMGSAATRRTLFNGVTVGPRIHSCPAQPQRTPYGINLASFRFSTPRVAHVWRLLILKATAKGSGYEEHVLGDLVSVDRRNVESIPDGIQRRYAVASPTLRSDVQKSQAWWIAVPAARLANGDTYYCWQYTLDGGWLSSPSARQIRRFARFTRSWAMPVVLESSLHRAEDPYEWVGLYNKTAARVASISVVLPPAAHHASAFGSVTDMTTGEAIPVPIHRSRSGSLLLRQRSCPPRTLLRIHWPLW